MRETIPKQMQPVYEAVVELIDKVCMDHLNEDYAELARRAAGKLARKRPSPLSKGKPASWACGIVYAIGKINFLFDPSQTPHLSATELSNRFGVSASNASAKAQVVLDALKAYQFDPNWCLPSRLDTHPLAWMVMVNGFLVDVRTMPREIQIEAYEKGIIPRLPDERMPRS